MGESLKLLGAKSYVAAWFADLDSTSGYIKGLIHNFDKRPPEDKDDFIKFLVQTQKIIKELDHAQNIARQGLEVAKDNGIISQHSDDIKALDEIIENLQKIRARLIAQREEEE